MFEKSSKRVLIAGFLVGIFILISLVVGIRHISDTHLKHLNEISIENTHTHHLTEMRNAAQRRSNLLLKMVSTNDAFERDMIFIQMKQEAIRFIEARDAFINGPNLSRYESETWEVVSGLVASASTGINEVATFLMDGQDIHALERLYKDVLSSQDEVLAILSGMLAFQRVEINSEIDRNIEGHHTKNLVMGILGSFGVIVFLAVAIAVYRLVISNESNIRKARTAAIEANRAKSSFLANMSHEMRTPLTAILGFSEQLSDPNSSDRDKIEAVSHITNNCSHLRNMINEILDLSKVEAGQLIVEREAVKVLSLIEEVQATIGEATRRKSLGLEVNIRYPIPALIETDETRLKQVLLNLLNNAVKFTSQGKIEVTVEYKAELHSLHFSVSDTGIGIEKETLSKLFVPYSQANSSIAQEYGGTGLGLAISRQLIEKLGGKLSVKSEVGEGSTFSFSIAAGLIANAEFIHSKQDSDEVNTSVEKVKSEVPIIKKQILLAEDNRVNQILISKLLRNTGAEIVVVDDGAAAVAAASERDFDLIIMDIRMPNMDGIEATKVIRQKGINTPVIALTANALIEDKNDCLQAGMNSYLTKPIEKDKFYSAILELTA